jgi:multidrug resistance efflux pump
MTKGERQEEIDALAARLAAAKATAENSKLELERQDALFKADAPSRRATTTARG